MSARAAFAKLFGHDGDQVLAFIDSAPDEDDAALVISCIPADLEWADVSRISIGFVGENAREMAQLALDALDEKGARMLAANVMGPFGPAGVGA